MKIISFLGALLFCLNLNAGEAKYKINWVLAHEPARVFLRAANEFKQRIEKESNGEITVNIVDSNKFFKGAVSAEKSFDLVKSGRVQMSQLYTNYLGYYDEQMRILDLPFLFKSHEHASKVLDGEIGKTILAGLEKTQVRGLAFTYSGGFRIIPTANAPLSTVESFKGKKIGYSGYSPIAKAYLKEIGAVPMDVKDTEINDNGTGEGFETTYARLAGIPNVKMKYLNETEHTLFLTSIVINNEFLQSLPETYRTLVQETARKVAAFERAESIQDNLTAKKDFVEKNHMQVVKLSDAEIAKMKVLSIPVYKSFSNKKDQDIITAIQNADSK